MTDVACGRLSPPSHAPREGERTEPLAQLRNLVVEHVLSGVLAAPVDYEQDHDEWALVLSGGAVLEVGDERLHLGDGDWVVLPANVPHRLVETRPGTSWLVARVF